MTKVRLSLSISDSHMGKINQVAQAAEEAGLKVEQRLNDLGVLIGSIDEDKVGQLHSLDGISHVEKAQVVGVPPPHSPIQ
jgi:hypothetical protein